MDRQKRVHGFYYSLFSQNVKKMMFLLSRQVYVWKRKALNLAKLNLMYYINNIIKTY